MWYVVCVMCYVCVVMGKQHVVCFCRNVSFRIESQASCAELDKTQGQGRHGRSIVAKMELEQTDSVPSVLYRSN